MSHCRAAAIHCAPLRLILLSAVLLGILASRAGAAILFDSMQDAGTEMFAQQDAAGAGAPEVAMRFKPESYGALDWIDVSLGLASIPTNPPMRWNSSVVPQKPSVTAVVKLYGSDGTTVGQELWRSNPVTAHAEPSGKQFALTLNVPRGGLSVPLRPDEYMFLAVDLLDVTEGLFPVNENGVLEAATVGYVGPSTVRSVQKGSATLDWFIRFDPESGWVRQASGATFAATVHSFVPGDANGDRRVDIGDLSVVVGNWLGENRSWSQGDFSGDGRVDGLDLASFATNWNSAIPFDAAIAGIGATDIPEPSLLGILLAAGLVVQRRPRCA